MFCIVHNSPQYTLFGGCVIFLLDITDFSGQVLSNLNLGNYLAGKLSSLKEIQNESRYANAKNSTLLSLGCAMRGLQK